MVPRRAPLAAAAALLCGLAALSLAVAGGTEALWWERPPGRALADLGWWLREDPVRDALMRGAERVGRPATLVAAFCVALCVAGWRRSWWLACGAVALSGACAAVGAVLKPLVGRTIGAGAALAFPSGHSSGSVAVAALGVGCAVVACSGRARGVLVALFVTLGVAGVCAPAVVGFHYPTDSLGSLLWIGSVVCAWWGLSPRLAQDARDRRAGALRGEGPAGGPAAAVAAGVRVRG